MFKDFHLLLTVKRNGGTFQEYFIFLSKNFVMMHRTLLLFLAVLLFQVPPAFGQRQIAAPENPKRAAIAPLPAAEAATFRAPMDTLYPLSFDDPCSDQLIFFTVSGSWGFVSGMNGFLDREKAQRFSISSNTLFTISEVWGFFSIAAVEQNGELAFNVYAVDEQTGGPDALLGTSESLRVSDLLLGDEFVEPTPFRFEEPLAVERQNFFVSCDFSDLYATEDTVALWMTEEMCGDGTDSWELYDEGVWVSMFETWEQLDADWAIAAIIEFDESTDVDDPFIAQNDLVLYPAFPNPAGAEIQLRYELQQGSRVRIELYAADGRLLRRTDEGLLPPGPHQHFVATDRLEAGTYVYAIVTEEGRLMSRFVVQ